jgi:hypothetical protein
MHDGCRGDAGTAPPEESARRQEETKVRKIMLLALMAMLALALYAPLP